MIFFEAMCYCAQYFELWIDSNWIHKYIILIYYEVYDIYNCYLHLGVLACNYIEEAGDASEDEKCGVVDEAEAIAASPQAES